MTAQPMDPKDVPAECDGADDPRERCGHHHTTSLGNAMGGYNCCCGWAWLPRANECSTGAKTGVPVPPGDYVCDLLAYVAATSGEDDYEAQAAAVIPAIRAQVADEILADACPPGEQCANRWCPDCVAYRQAQRDAKIARGDQ